MTRLEDGLGFKGMLETGALMDIRVHVADLARWLTGRRKPVKALGAAYSPRTI